MDAYKTIGFEPCDSADFEEGHIKVALYVDNTGNVTHAAIQKPEWKGKWRSKLGDLEDIEHDLDAVGGGFYGEPLYFMKKRDQVEAEESST